MAVLPLPVSCLPIIFLVLFGVVIGTESCPGGEPVVRGCKITPELACSCGVGCKSEFKFSNKDECKAALKNTGRWDACNATPCANGGLCTQVQKYYRCRCEGTGYYGPRCQYPCPVPGASSVKVFPYECIVI